MRTSIFVALSSAACGDDVPYGPPCEVPPSVELIAGEKMHTVDGRIHMVADLGLFEGLFLLPAITWCFDVVTTGLGDTPYAYGHLLDPPITDSIGLTNARIAVASPAVELPVLLVELPPCDYDADRCACARTAYIIMAPEIAMQILDLGPLPADLTFTEMGWPCFLADGSIGGYACPVTFDASVPILIEVIRAR